MVCASRDGRIQWAVVEVRGESSASAGTDGRCSEGTEEDIVLRSLMTPVGSTRPRDAPHKESEGIGAVGDLVGD